MCGRAGVKLRQTWNQFYKYNLKSKFQLEAYLACLGIQALFVGKQANWAHSDCLNNTVKWKKNNKKQIQMEEISIFTMWTAVNVLFIESTLP